MRKLLLFAMLVIPLSGSARIKKSEPVQMSDRDYWCHTAYQMAAPVLELLAGGRLQECMPVEVSPHWDGRNVKVAYLECFGRLMCGIAPWLSLPDDDSPESAMRSRLREWALKAYANAVNPDSPDYMLWRQENQTLVDAAFLAESFLRGYEALWESLDEVTKARYIEEFTLLRRVNPPYNNWLLFSSTVEAFLAKAGAPYDKFRVTTALRKIDEWYVGDGWYSDGQKFAFDYYGSYVIHPMYLETMKAMMDAGVNYDEAYARGLKRTQRFAVILERFISPEGTFPVFGRSSTYRISALQPLGLIALYDKLPAEISRGQVRAALTANLHRMFDTQGNYTEDGFLRIGFCGSQPEMSDGYTNNGSLYLASTGLLPLGLPADHPFWTCDPEPWTQCKAWGGQSFPKDHAWND